MRFHNDIDQLFHIRGAIIISLYHHHCFFSITRFLIYLELSTFLSILTWVALLQLSLKVPLISKWASVTHRFFRLIIHNPKDLDCLFSGPFWRYWRARTLGRRIFSQSILSGISLQNLYLRYFFLDICVWAIVNSDFWKADKTFPGCEDCHWVPQTWSLAQVKPQFPISVWHPTIGKSSPHICSGKLSFLGERHRHGVIWFS